MLRAGRHRRPRKQVLLKESVQACEVVNTERSVRGGNESSGDQRNS